MASESKLIVTGSCGFLGQRVVEQAERQGWTVAEADVAAARPIDVRDKECLEGLFEQVRPDAVIHTASTRESTSMNDVILRGAETIAGLSADHGTRLIHVSSDAVFSGMKGAPYTESDVADPVTAYGVAKHASEIAVMHLYPKAVVVRTSLLLGSLAAPGLHEMLALRQDVSFWTDYIRCPLSVGDLATALLQLVPIDFSGILNIAGDRPLSRADLAELVCGHEVPQCMAPPGIPCDVRLDTTTAREKLGILVRGPHDLYRK